jgi:hypothetical protein
MTPIPEWQLVLDVGHPVDPVLSTVVREQHNSPNVFSLVFSWVG